jgi:hypothetical protein
MLVQVFPLLALSILAYNILVLIVGGGPVVLADGTATDAMAVFMNKGIGITLFSGVQWKFTIGDLFIVISLILLFVEILKSTVTTANSIANHSLSLLVGIVGLIEFLMFKGFGTSPFFLVIVMCVIDVIAGFSITIVASKRDFGVAPPVVG